MSDPGVCELDLFSFESLAKNDADNTAELFMILNVIVTPVVWTMMNLFGIVGVLEHIDEEE